MEAHVEVYYFFLEWTVLRKFHSHLESGWFVTYKAVIYECHIIIMFL